MDIPVTVTTHSIEVDVTNEVVSVVVAVQTKTIQVTINYGLNATQVDAAIDAKLTKENVVGLKLTDSPEFADTEITPLALEATYTPTVWAYLVGIFTTVPKSVKEHIVKIWSRLQLLEDNYILKYVVPVDAVSIILTTDKYGNAFDFDENIKLSIQIDIEHTYTGNTGTGFKINNRIDSIYRNSSSTGNKHHLLYGQNHRYIKGILNYGILNNDGLGYFTSLVTLSDGTAGSSYSIGLATIGLNESKITQLEFFVQVGNIKAGSKIIIKKI